MRAVMQIPFVNLKAQYQAYQAEIDEAVKSVLVNANFVHGQEIAELEQALSEFCGAPFSITCGNGTDALMLALMAIDIKPGDEIITTPFSFFATAEVICFIGATPVFVDIEPDTFLIDANKIEAAITPKTKAIMPVSLYGQVADMNAINDIALKHSLVVIEDAAQSFGAEYHGKKSCNLSKLACTSFFPAKPLGCYGDGGAVFTNDEKLAVKLKSLRNHGQGERYKHHQIGVNSRMDTIQAAILRVKLKYFTQEIKQRQLLASRYDALFSETTLVVPTVKENRISVFAQYTLRSKNRDGIIDALKEAGIPTAIHYPIPMHLQDALQHLGYQKGDFPLAEQAAIEVFSLPMCAFQSDSDFELIKNTMHDYLVMDLQLVD